MHPAALISDLGTAGPAAWAWLGAAWDGFLQGAGATLVTSIWQGAVIVCGLEMAFGIMRRSSASHRFAVWAAGFGVAAGLPLLPLIDPITIGSGRASAEIATQAHALWQIDARWGLAIAGLWVVASAIRGAGLLMQSIRLRRLWKTAAPVRVSDHLAAALKHVRRGNVEICTTQRLDRPSVIGFLAPRILIPDWLIDRLTPGELEQIVLHEAEHLRRCDDWTNLAQKLALVLFPLNPALVWLEHRLCRDREMACDEGVVRITNAPRAYAACLASLAERGLERRAEALSLGAWRKRSELVHRVHGILSGKRGMSQKAAGALLAAIGCALLAATVEMARAPELVAFVPEQNQLAMTPARQQQMEALLARESADAEMRLPSGYHAVSTKAVLPEVLSQHHHESLASRTTGVVSPTAPRAAARKVKTTIPDASQLAKADAAGDRVDAGSEQQWIVLSAWEEVRTVSPANGSDQIADYDVRANAASTPEGRDLAKAIGPEKTKSRQATTSYTVTQLILRVVPANPAANSTQPGAGTLRGGWFVIQL